MKKTISVFLLFFSGITAQSNVDWSSEVFPILQSASCLGSCHGSGSSGGLTIGTSASTAYNNIVDVASGCNNMDYIEPGDPNTSHLYLKCTSSFSCGGSRMPRNNTSYFSTNSDQLETIRVWIEEGALEQAQETDTTPPELVNLSIDQDTLDLVDGPDTVSFTIIARDAGSGLSTCLGKVIHTNDVDEVSFTAAFTSGDTLDTVAFEIVMADTGTLGDWTISYLQLTDVDGNDTTYTSTQLASAGFDTGFVLINSTPVAVGPDRELIPGEFALFPNYPNPFNPTTTVRYYLPVRSSVKIMILDMRGRKVRELVNRDLVSGHQGVLWDGKDFRGHSVTSGVYIVSIEANGFRQTRKMVLLK